MTGKVSIPGGGFELLDASGSTTISGRFRGAGGNGALVLRVDGDRLTGEFDLGGQAGVIDARRTEADAQTFFRPPEQRLDIATDQWLGDLDALVRILKSEHGAPFRRVSTDQFDREVARTRSAIPRLSGIEVALEFRRLGALIGDGHTSVDLPNGLPRFPLEFYVFDDGVRVVSTAPEFSQLMGAKLTAINDVPVSGVIARLRAFVAAGETDWFYRSTMPDLVIRPNVLRAAGIGEGPAFSFTFETDQGQNRENLTATEVLGRVIQDAGKPLWRRNVEKDFWSERLNDGSVYVNWRSYDDLTDHAKALLHDMNTKRPNRLIVDLRDNDGGDYNAGRKLIDEIRHRPWLNKRGVLYVLIGRKTFSAAMTNAIDFKTLTEATLIGEPAGAAPNNWQEVRRFNLPNSGLRVGVSTRYYAFLPGAPELRPDHLVPPVLSDWGADVDSAVRFVVERPMPH
ncbi:MULTISPECIES: hypothetical protein [unclassified Chelatococcus]|uniref:hypothetical protein n=1 Tax=unclassified Chelatococcus TaxID=2638111 RepID=UPI001BD1506C|nr:MULTISPECIES: hypothetical protein [unclassified Chelatococcus]MBS7700427.1 hypothetical protein [Chelatococcus sp. YT9]MBX3556223.1 hypothetical protein [Chelatococcus sp.]